MVRIEANNLQEAFSQAAAELSCSVTEIDIEVIQHPSSGFLGMFKKTAIIEARRSGEKPSKPKRERKDRNNKKREESSENNKEEKRTPRNRRRNKKQSDRASKDNQQNSKQERKQQPRKDTPKPPKKEEQKVESKVNTPKSAPKEIVSKPKVDVYIAVPEIKEQINSLFQHSCFELDAIKVEAYNEDTVLIEFAGVDSALLIGKEGYRYKSLSYLLYNWVNLKYNLNIRLEIAEFLKNQEEMIEKYLVSVIDRVNNNGRAQTKILDGVLVKIALELLRKEFPNKYVGIKTGREGGKFIVINDFNRKNSQ